MKKGRTTTIILFSVLGVLLLLYFIFSGSDEKHYQWYESYDTKSDQPYGTLFVRKLLESYRHDAHFIFNEKKPLKELLKTAEVKPNTDYIFIGPSIYLDDEDTNALLDFVESGNDAFLASLALPTDLIDRFYTNECDVEFFFQTNKVESVTFNFYHDTLATQKGYNYAFRLGSEDKPYFWNSLTDQILCDSTKSIIPLGYQYPNRVNFFKIPYGKGNLYVHSNPLAFTNYFLSNVGKVDYASGVFSHLKGDNIIWDEYSKMPLWGNNNVYDSPLSYILRQPSLKYAWWLLIISVLIYVFFAAKRTQRVIPLLEAKTNTSLEFINLISALHYQNGNHLDMARKKMKYFLHFIRAKYGVHHTHTSTNEQILKLAEKSKISVADVQLIFDKYNLIDRYSYSNTEPDRLVDLYYAIENFYKHCT